MMEAVPRGLRALAYKSTRAPWYLTEQLLLRRLHLFDAVYLFPAISPQTVGRVHKKGMPILLERVNCAQQTARHILDDAYRRLDLPPAHPITAQGIAAERDEIKCADYLICPSPLVRESFLALGVPPEKLIASSYGWSPRRFGNIPAKEQNPGTFTVLFVGRVCVRKGAHLLLDAWAKAGVRGRLILCGDLEPAIANACRTHLSRPDVIHLPFQRDVSSLYKQADLFAFPALEEGSPLVMYEAMAHGLPIVTSPMGAGAGVRDDVEGMILDPYAQDAWVEALRALARTPELLGRFGAAARRRAQEFTWEKVAARRGSALVSRLRGATD